MNNEHGCTGDYVEAVISTIARNEAEIADLRLDVAAAAGPVALGAEIR